MFPFLTMDRMTMARALGLETVSITAVLSGVAPGQIDSEEEIRSKLPEDSFIQSYVDAELESLQWMRSHYRDRWVGGGCFGPLTVASDILGAEYLLRDIMKKPDYVLELVDRITNCICSLAEAEQQEGQDFFWIAEPIASLLSPRMFRKFSGDHLKRIFSSIDAPGFLHVCGKTDSHTKELEACGPQVLSIDYVTDIKTCIETVSGDTVIMGNVSPMLLQLGSRREAEAAVWKVLEDCEGHPNLIVSSGCSIMSGTPPENVDALFDITEKYDLAHPRS